VPNGFGFKNVLPSVAQGKEGAARVNVTIEPDERCKNESRASKDVELSIPI
jgi:hypothetical protein